VLGLGLFSSRGHTYLRISWKINCCSVEGDAKRRSAICHREVIIEDPRSIVDDEGIQPRHCRLH
jgi:hypothetical protein